MFSSQAPFSLRAPRWAVRRNVSSASSISLNSQTQATSMLRRLLRGALTQAQGKEVLREQVVVGNFENLSGPHAAGLPRNGRRAQSARASIGSEFGSHAVMTISTDAQWLHSPAPPPACPVLPSAPDWRRFTPSGHDTPFLIDYVRLLLALIWTIRISTHHANSIIGIFRIDVPTSTIVV